MKRLRFWVLCCLGILLTAFPVQAQQVLFYASNPANAQAPVAVHRVAHERDRLSEWVAQAVPEVKPDITTEGPPGSSGEPALQPFDQVVKDTQTLTGLFTLYRNQEAGKVYLEIQPRQLNQNFLCVSTLESGVGERGLYRGWPLDDFLFEFRRVNNRVQLTVPNIHFRTDPTDPQRRSVDESFSDSVLYTFNVLSIHPQRQSLLVDLGQMFAEGQDLSGLASALPRILGGSYSLDPGSTYLEQLRVFPLNIELETVYSFSGGGGFDTLETLPDSRAFNVSVRYSLSQVPANGYRPRLADDRVGYFITAYQNLSDRSFNQPFVRYIQRWKLEKQDPTAELSPPKEPVVFWIENTVPTEYREAIREGVLLWNSAFEKAGFQNAIEVRQMPDDADWDPADIRYNTIRWSNSYQSWIMAIGPSRVNPVTGQILDADVVIDANAVRFLQQSADVLVQNRQGLESSAFAPVVSAELCNPRLRSIYQQWLAGRAQTTEGSQANSAGESRSPVHTDHDMCFGMESAQQLAFGSLALSTMQNLLPSGDEMQEYVHQYLRYLTAHEVGHTLGLRHNFRGSMMLSPEDLQNPGVTRAQGMVGSVMDYVPVNLAPQGMPQGDYFPTTLGPYDLWAIEYGYKTTSAGTPQAEVRELQQIAQKSGGLGLSFSTDEDAYDLLDPSANVWDLSSDMLLYSQWQLDNALAIWERLGRRYPLPGESYSDLRDRFDTVFFYYVGYALSPTRYIGGQTFNRGRRGDSGGRLPFESVPVEQQRRALELLQKYVFSDDVFNFSPELINQLAPSRWQHWGASPAIFRLDYPIYDNISTLQSIALSDLLSSERLTRLRDAELRSNAGETLTLPELFDTLQNGIWTEILQPEQDLKEISSLRRGLQRQYMNILVNMTLRTTPRLENATSFVDFIVALLTSAPPEDARVLARYHLRDLQEAIASTLRRQGRDLDITTRAHLEEASDRIAKTLEAPLQSS